MLSPMQAHLFHLSLQRKIVKKSTTDKKCYAYIMPKAETTPDEIKEGVLQVSGI